MIFFTILRSYHKFKLIQWKKLIKFIQDNVNTQNLRPKHCQSKALEDTDVVFKGKYLSKFVLHKYMAKYFVGVINQIQERKRILKS